MGEAKRRKLDEPMFGKIPNSSIPRGIVISSPMTVEGQSLQLKGYNLHPDELRFALLYWDKLAWPTQNIMTGSLTKDEDLLIDLGVIERPHFDFQGELAQGMLNGHLDIFEKKSDSSPGLWSLSEGQNSLDFILGAEKFDAVDSLSVRLARSIPIPGVDMSIEQILKFKEKRRDELRELRACLEFSTQSYHAMGSPEDYLQFQINQMRDACANLLRVSSEWQSPFYVSDISTSLSFGLKDLGIAYVAFEKALAGTGSMAAAMTSGILAGAVSVNLTPKLRWVKKDLGPYKYVYKMHKDLV